MNFFVVSLFEVLCVICLFKKKVVIYEEIFFILRKLFRGWRFLLTGNIFDWFEELVCFF